MVRLSAPGRNWSKYDVSKQWVRARQKIIEDMRRLGKVAAAWIVGAGLLPLGGAHAEWEGLSEGL